jgi:hypothetical protein
VFLQNFQSLLNQFRQILILSLGVVNLVPDVQSLVFKHVKNRKNLSVVRNQSLTNHLSGQYQLLNLFQCRANDLRILGRKSLLNWNDQLRQNWQQFVWVSFNQLISTLVGQKLVRLLCFPQALEKDWKVQMIIQMLRLHFPCQFSKSTNETHGHWQVSSVVVLSEKSGFLEYFTLGFENVRRWGFRQRHLFLWCQ